jgi:hypothetical protein
MPACTMRPSLNTTWSEGPLGTLWTRTGVAASDLQIVIPSKIICCKRCRCAYFSSKKEFCTWHRVDNTKWPSAGNTWWPKWADPLSWSWSKRICISCNRISMYNCMSKHAQVTIIIVPCGHVSAALKSSMSLYTTHPVTLGNIFFSCHGTNLFVASHPFGQNLPSICMSNPNEMVNFLICLTFSTKNLS